jgi:hypothetical protein
MPRRRASSIRVAMTASQLRRALLEAHACDERTFLDRLTSPNT